MHVTVLISSIEHYPKNPLFSISPFKNVSYNIEMGVSKPLVEADVFGVGYQTCSY